MGVHDIVNLKHLRKLSILEMLRPILEGWDKDTGIGHTVIAQESF
jgi:hypothetical protein